MPQTVESIYLVAPAFKGVTGERHFAPPLSLETVAALTPEGIEVSITDENLDPVDLNKSADLVGITVVTHTAIRAYELADAFRARGKKVVLGGVHPTALPEEALQHADAVVVGEAENMWPQMLDDLREGHLQQIYRSAERPSLNNLPYPRRDLIRRDSYLFPDTVSTTRGCPNGCDFCAVTSFFGRTYRSRPVEDVVGEVDTLDRRVFFVDDNIAGNPRRARELFGRLAQRKRRLAWIGQASVTIGHKSNEDLLELAARSGCLALFLGIESLSPENLALANKRCNDVEEYEDAIRRIHKHGIAVFGAFIFGLKYDTQDIFEQTLRFARHNRLEGAQFNILTPYPGTRLFNQMDRDGGILTKDWSQYHADQVVFKPTCMSADQLKKGRDWTEREFFSLGSIWERIGLRHPHLVPIWALNLNYRRDRASRLILGAVLSLAKRSL